MAERRSGLPIDASRRTTSDGRDFVGNASGFLDNFHKTDDMYSNFGEKGVVWKAYTPDFDAEIMSLDELPKIIVMESPGLPNDDIGRRGC